MVSRRRKKTRRATTSEAVTMRRGCTLRDPTGSVEGTQRGMRNTPVMIDIDPRTSQTKEINGSHTTSLSINPSLGNRQGIKGCQGTNKRRSDPALIKIDSSCEESISVLSKPPSTLFSRRSISINMATGAPPSPLSARPQRSAAKPSTSTPERPKASATTHKSGSPVSVMDTTASSLSHHTRSMRPPLTDTASRAAASQAMRRRRREQERAAWLRRQRDYWHSIVVKRCVQRGPRDIKTADALLHLGDAQMALQDYKEAVRSFTSAKNIYVDELDDSHLNVARTLDKLGHAMCKAQVNIVEALGFLNRALAIRCENLGPSHVDSVDTLNHIAGIRMKCKHYHHAANDYHAVLCWREQLFGRAHTSVAVSAINLASVLQQGLHRPDQARTFYRIAEDSYAQLGVDSNAQPMREIRQYIAATYATSGSSVCETNLRSIREGGKLVDNDTDESPQPSSFMTSATASSSSDNWSCDAESVNDDIQPRSSLSVLIEI